MNFSGYLVDICPVLAQNPCISSVRIGKSVMFLEEKNEQVNYSLKGRLRCYSSWNIKYLDRDTKVSILNPLFNLYKFKGPFYIYWMTISLVVDADPTLMSTVGLSLQHCSTARWTLWFSNADIKSMFTGLPLSTAV